MKFVQLLTIAFLLGVPLVTQGETAESIDKLYVVQEFIDAFNEHDERAMGGLVTADVKWLSVSGESISVEVAGREALIAAMGEYFAPCSSCQSKIARTLSTRERVSVLEIASWETGEGTASQQALAVYEFSDGLISGVYYFPEERTEDSH